MLNHITVMGRLTRDPELKTTPNGISVTSFNLAVDRDFEKGKTDFIDCIAWRNTAEFICRNLTKGRMAIISGRLQVRDWTDKEGKTRKAVEVIADNVFFGDSKKPEKQEQFTEIDDYEELPF